MKKTLFTLAVLSSSVMAGNVENGKALFDKHCVSCHNETKEKYPSLERTEYFSVAHLKESIVNPRKVITTGYGYDMPSFIWMDNKSIEDLKSYLKNRK
jgi:mono/diheme cytochrome c family protein